MWRRAPRPSAERSDATVEQTLQSVASDVDLGFPTCRVPHPSRVLGERVGVLIPVPSHQPSLLRSDRFQGGQFRSAPLKTDTYRSQREKPGDTRGRSLFHVSLCNQHSPPQSASPFAVFQRFPFALCLFCHFLRSLSNPIHLSHMPPTNYSFKVVFRVFRDFHSVPVKPL
jgi:hypothetical protein